MASNRIIVNADDFGADSRTNARIIECFERGLISTASVMVTMPGYDEVVSWYSSRQQKPKLGIHLDLDEGIAVSSSFSTTYGSSKLFYRGNFLVTGTTYLGIISRELDAQINKFVASGMPLNHIDSHHHLHNHFRIARVVVSLARKYGVARLRAAGNMCYPNVPHKRVYRFLINQYFRWKYPRTDAPYFTHLDRFFVTRPVIPKSAVELMTHPGYDEDYEFLLSEPYAEFLQSYELYVG